MHISVQVLLTLPLTARLAVAIALPTPTPIANSPVLIHRDTTAEIAPTPAPTGYYTSTEHIVVGGVTNDRVTIPGKTIDIAIPTCVQTIVPDANGYVPPGTCGAIWAYYPNFNAAVVFAVLYAAVTVLHIWQAIRYKKPFCWVIVMACVWETLAYTFRAVSARNQQNVGIYLIFQIFILLAPLWVNAFDYMVLGRVIWYLSPTRSLMGIPAPTIAFVFVLLDIVSFVVQLVGGSMAGPRSPIDDQMKAIHIYMGGIGLQEFFIVVFVGLAIKFQWDTKKSGQTMVGLGRNGKWLMAVLYASLALISTRIVFRFVEFSAGTPETNPLLTNEAFYYGLEAVPMFLALLSFNIVHPGSVLVGPDSEMPGLWTTIKSFCGSRKAKKNSKASSGYVEMSDVDSVHSEDQRRSRVMLSDGQQYDRIELGTVGVASMTRLK